MKQTNSSKLVILTMKTFKNYIIIRVGSGFFEIFKTAGIFHFDATRL